MSPADKRALLFDLQKQHSERTYGQAALRDGPVFSEQSLVHWSHVLPLRDLAPIFQTGEKYRVLTIGDGRGGQEANFFKRLGHHATASDLSADLLGKAKAEGKIDDYLPLNAEQLDLPANSFDFAVVKEALHHLQRPYQAIYEMLRVARRGIVIIEPHYRIPTGVRTCLRQLFRRLIGRSGSALLPRATYESAGNLVYRFSPYELSQCALGMGLTSVAFCFSNGCYNLPRRITAAQFSSKLTRKLERRWRRRDVVSGKNYRPLLTFVIYKSEFPPDLKGQLLDNGFHVPTLPANPQLTQQTKLAA